VGTVLIGGHVRNWCGELVGVDLTRVRALAYESRDYLAARAGFRVNPVVAPSRREIQDPYLGEHFA
jgi:hypothetical protein